MSGGDTLHLQIFRRVPRQLQNLIKRNLINYDIFGAIISVQSKNDLVEWTKFLLVEQNMVII